MAELIELSFGKWVESPTRYACRTSHGWEIYIYLHMRTYERTPFPNLGNDWDHCVEICYVVIDQLAKHLIQATSNFVCFVGWKPFRPVRTIAALRDI